MSLYRVSLIIAIGLCLFIVFVGILPKRESLETFREMIAQKQAEMETESRYVKSLSENYKKIEENQELISKMEGAIPGSHLLPDLLNFLSETSVNSGLVLEGVNPALVYAVDQKEESLNSAVIKLSMTGDYPSFKKFVSRLEQSTRLIEVEKISLSSKDTAGISRPLFDFSLSLRSYFE